MSDAHPDGAATVSHAPTFAAPTGPAPPPVCPACAGPWQPYDYRGPLTFRHRLPCDIDAADIQTTCADSANRYTDEWSRFPRDSFHRDATPAEARLLAVLDTPPNARIHVEWDTGIRRRTPVSPTPTARGGRINGPPA